MRRVYFTLLLLVAAVAVALLPRTVPGVLATPGWNLQQEGSVPPTVSSIPGSVVLGEGVTLLVVDTSGSMRSEERRSQEALNALLALSPEKLGLVTYGDSARVVVEPGPSTELIQEVMGSLPSRGGSNLYAGLSEALDWFAYHREAGNIVLVSDGSANVGEVDPRRILQLSGRARDLAVRIYGVESGEPEGTLLRDLSEAGGGRTWAAGQTLEFRSVGGLY